MAERGVMCVTEKSMRIFMGLASHCMPDGSAVT